MMMKKVILWCTAMMGFSLSGCSPGAEEEIPSTASRLIVRTASEEVTARSAGGNLSEAIVFTGDDILWFNETTKEIRFKDNVSNNPHNKGFGKSIKFYIDDEYLFSSMVYVSDISSLTYNSPVFYYNLTENKFYLKDGYPDASVLQNGEAAQAERDENMRKIAAEWNRFIELMKNEGRYRK
jgi:hypothetical protein